jgi:prevent-host-death family protein
MDVPGKSKEIPAGQFKQGCLAILDEVEAKHIEVIITKRGRPVAKLVPIRTDDAREAAILEDLRGGCTALVDEATLLAPMTDEWGDVG